MELGIEQIANRCGIADCRSSLTLSSPTYFPILLLQIRLHYPPLFPSTSHSSSSHSSRLSFPSNSLPLTQHSLCSPPISNPSPPYTISNFCSIPALHLHFPSSPISSTSSFYFLLLLGPSNSSKSLYFSTSVSTATLPSPLPLPPSVCIHFLLFPTHLPILTTFSTA